MHSRRNQNKIVFGFAVFFVFIMFVSCSSAKSQVNAGPDGIAIKGYDPVAYFTEGQSVKGVNQFSFDWKGAKWLFSNREHLALFSADTEKYAPQYGGY
jgi:hypothetical protein